MNTPRNGTSADIRSRLLASVEDGGLPPPRPSLRQVVLENMDVIVILREKGHGWARIAQLLADAGASGDDGLPPRPDTLRKYFHAYGPAPAAEGPAPQTVRRPPARARPMETRPGRPVVATDVRPPVTARSERQAEERTTTPPPGPPSPGRPPPAQTNGAGETVAGGQATVNNPPQTSSRLSRGRGLEGLLSDEEDP